MIFILQFSLGALRARANGLGIISVKGAAGFGVKQLGPVLVVASDEQGDAKRPAHDSLLAFGALSEAQSEITDGLSGALDAEGLVVVEVVILALDAGVLNHGAGVGLQARHGAANVTVNFDNLLDRRRLE